MSTQDLPERELRSAQHEATRLSVRVQSAPFDIGAGIDRMRAGDARIGAIATFIGTVRDVNDAARVTAMELEHYPGMTERSLGEITGDAARRWNILGASIVHRIGTLMPADPIVMVVVTSAHRRDAFAACEFIMDYLKTRAPFWKKESTPAGDRWVEAHASDDDAAARW